jgi:hypothetical protein
MLKKRLIAHPGIEVVDRQKLFNFDKCLTQYLSIYANLHKAKKPEAKNIGLFFSNLE